MVQTLRDLSKWIVPALLIVASVPLRPQERQITIQVINGKNGKQIRDARLLIFGGETPDDVKEHAQGNVQLVTDKNGVATLAVPSAKFRWFQLFVDTMKLCQNTPNLFSVNEITSAGLQTPNICSQLTRTAAQGNLIVFARPATFWERMRW